MENVDLVVKPFEFFKDQVNEATERLKIELIEDVEFYVVNLLSEFVFTSSLSTNDKEDCAFTQPMALLYKKALESPPEKRSGIFKKMGDTSLYVAGYFQDYFNRKTYDIEYYINMGQSAYEGLSNLMKNRYADEHFSHIYHTLSEQFQDIVDVVAEVSETPATKQMNSDNILSIYDRWNQTKSERLRRILEEAGIDPIETTRKAQ